MDVLCNHHKPSIYYSLEMLLKDRAGEPEKEFDSVYHRRVRFWTRKWKAWRNRHPDEPFVLRCQVCSGREQKVLKKLGKWNPSTRGREQRDDAWKEGD